MKVHHVTLAPGKYCGRCGRKRTSHFLAKHEFVQRLEHCEQCRVRLTVGDRVAYVRTRPAMADGDPNGPEVKVYRCEDCAEGWAP